MGEFVYTQRGSGRIANLHIVRSGSVSILRKDATLRRHDKETVIPAGTFFRRDDRLTRQTEKKAPSDRVTHMIIEEGGHAAARQCLHIQDFESEDGAEMLERGPQMDRIVKDLYVCGQLSFDDHERITKNLAFCRESFDEFKKNEIKADVRKRIDTANAQRSKIGRFRAMPAYAAAFASKRGIRARFKETVGIHAAFGVNYLAVDDLLVETYNCASAVWTVIRPDKGTVNGVIARAMSRHGRGRETVRSALQSVQAMLANLGNIIILPYLPIAQATMEACRTLHWSIDNDRRMRMDESVERVRYLVRRMRMLWHVETELIDPLSFPTETGYSPRVIKAFDGLLVQAEMLVKDMQDTGFDPALRQLVQEYLEATRTNASLGDYERAREELKRLTHELRVQPVIGRKAA